MCRMDQIRLLGKPGKEARPDGESNARPNILTSAGLLPFTRGWLQALSRRRITEPTVPAFAPTGANLFSAIPRTALQPPLWLVPFYTVFVARVLRTAIAGRACYLGPYRSIVSPTRRDTTTAIYATPANCSSYSASGFGS